MAVGSWYVGIFGVLEKQLVSLPHSICCFSSPLTERQRGKKTYIKRMQEEERDKILIPLFFAQASAAVQFKQCSRRTIRPDLSHLIITHIAEYPSSVAMQLNVTCILGSFGMVVGDIWELI